MADEPVSAWREPLPQSARRWARRHRTATTGVAVGLVAGVIGLGAVASIQAWYNSMLTQANSKLTDANDATTRALAETQAEKRKADQALAESLAVSSFLVEAFRSPDPSLDGRHVKLAEVLDRAGEARQGVCRVAGDEGGAAECLGHDVAGPGST